MTRAVRGAIQVPENSRQAIEGASVRLLGEIVRINAIDEHRIVSILFSVTEDLSAGNPATGLRLVGFAATTLLCAQEPRIEGALPRTIRVLVTFESANRREAVPVYLDGAESLRPDLSRGGGS